MSSVVARCSLVALNAHSGPDIAWNLTVFSGLGCGCYWLFTCIFFAFFSHFFGARLFTPV